MFLLGGWGRVLKGKGSIFNGPNINRQRAGRMIYHSLHAEMNVIFKILKLEHKTNRFMRKTPIKRPATTIYVVRLLNEKNIPKNQTHLFGNSKPCKHCQKFLRFYNVTKVKYTDIIDGQNVLCEMRLI